MAVDCKKHLKVDIKKAIKILKKNIAPGPDNTPAEAPKADIETSTQMHYELFGKTSEEDVPLERNNAYISSMDSFK